MQCDLQTPATGKVDKNFDVGVHSRLEKAYISGHELVCAWERDHQWTLICALACIILAAWNRNVPIVCSWYS
jgi:hypothetical protein